MRCYALISSFVLLVNGMSAIFVFKLYFDSVWWTYTRREKCNYSVRPLQEDGSNGTTPVSTLVLNSYSQLTQYLNTTNRTSKEFCLDGSWNRCYISLQQCEINISTTVPIPVIARDKTEGLGILFLSFNVTVVVFFTVAVMTHIAQALLDARLQHAYIRAVTENASSLRRNCPECGGSPQSTDVAETTFVESQDTDSENENTEFGTLLTLLSKATGSKEKAEFLRQRRNVVSSLLCKSDNPGNDINKQEESRSVRKTARLYAAFQCPECSHHLMRVKSKIKASRERRAVVRLLCGVLHVTVVCLMLVNLYSAYVYNRHLHLFSFGKSSSPGFIAINVLMLATSVSLTGFYIFTLVVNRKMKRAENNLCRWVSDKEAAVNNDNFRLFLLPNCQTCKENSNLSENDLSVVQRLQGLQALDGPKKPVWMMNTDLLETIEHESSGESGCGRKGWWWQKSMNNSNQRVSYLKSCMCTCLGTCMGKISCLLTVVAFLCLAGYLAYIFIRAKITGIPVVFA